MDVEANATTVVGLEGLQPDSLLTEAFHRPTILASARDFVSSNRHFASRASSTNMMMDLDVPTRTLVVGWTTRREYIIYLSAVVILLSVAAGVLIGFLTHSGSLGVAVSSGLGTVLSCVEVLVCWHFR